MMKYTHPAIIVSLEPSSIAVTAVGPGGQCVLREFGQISTAEFDSGELNLKQAAYEANTYARAAADALGIESRLLPVVPAEDA
jgi:hypothetical protein